MYLRHLSAILENSPELASLLTYGDLQLFCDTVRWLREDIASVQASWITTPPEVLPIKVHNFLMCALSITDEATKIAWSKLRELAWDVPASSEMRDPDVQLRARALLPLFLQYGIRFNLGFYNIRPPTRTCNDSKCARTYAWDQGTLHPRELGEPLEYWATAFTRDFGPTPVRVISLYCRGCHTRYYPNYFLHDQASTRTYYSGVPRLLQVAQHSFVSADVCEMFSNLMAVAWTSATNCARFYNSSLAPPDIAELLPIDWEYSFEVDTEQVWDSFFLYSLLLDHQERQTTLILPHVAPSQAYRLKEAIHARNMIMAGPGQEHWSHACDLCCWVHQTEDGTAQRVRSVITDGVGIGHPCCGVHDCKLPLIRAKGARYCAQHSSMEAQCSVLSCPLAAEKGFRTCAIPEHRQLDEHLQLENKAMFQLKSRFDRLNTLQAKKNILSTVLEVDSLRSGIVNQPSTTPLSPARTGTGAASATLPLSRMPTQLPSQSPPSESEVLSSTLVEDGSAEDSELEIRNEEVECNAKSPEGNKRIRALFGRRRTHNEELAVASCGVILGRATFYGSEAIGGVLEFWKGLFPTVESLPEVLWHDQNCRLWSTLQNADQDTQDFFARVALPVDVFHFKCKHKEGDIVCGTHCNPYIWPELRTDDGKWRFNSSAAEQANVWFGKFLPIVREMEGTRFNFFLDEMIKRRNRLTVKELRRKGHRPYLIPRETLLSDTMTA